MKKTEEELTRALEQEVGIDLAFKLMRLYQKAQEVASGNYYTPQGNKLPAADERFFQMAIARGYSQRAIKIYFELIRGER